MEQKFRAWDGYRMVHFSGFSIGLTKGKEVKPYVFFTEDTFKGEVRMGNHKVMQSTETFDKKGKEIFEGDMFQSHNSERKTGVVKFGHYTNMWDETEVNGGGHVGFYVDFESEFIRKDLKFWASNYEVIGNIHENGGKI